MKLRSNKSADADSGACLSAEDRSLLSVQFIDTYIGSGVFATVDLEKGLLVCFYEGEQISGKEGLKRFCSLPKHEGSFLFFFRHKGNEFCIDATHSSGCGRMLNDSRKPNCKVVVEQKEEGDDLKLAIYTLKAICKGSELRFDYNDRNAFWRRKNAAREIIYPVTDSKHEVILEEKCHQTDVRTNPPPDVSTCYLTDIVQHLQDDTGKLDQVDVDTNSLTDGPLHEQTDTEYHLQVETKKHHQADVEMNTLTDVSLCEQADPEHHLQVEPEKRHQSDVEMNSLTNVSLHEQTDTEHHLQVELEKQHQADVEMNTLTDIYLCEQTYIEQPLRVDTEKQQQDDVNRNTLIDISLRVQTDIEHHIQVETEEQHQADVEMNSLTDVSLGEQTDIEHHLQSETEKHHQADVEMNTLTDVSLREQTDPEQHLQADAEKQPQADVEINSLTDVSLREQTDIGQHLQGDVEKLNQADVKMNSLTDVSLREQTDIEHHFQSETEKHYQADVEMNTLTDVSLHEQTDTEQPLQADAEKQQQADVEMNTLTDGPLREQTYIRQHLQGDVKKLHQGGIEMNTLTDVSLREQTDRDQHLQVDAEKQHQADVDMNTMTDDLEQHLHVNTEKHQDVEMNTLKDESFCEQTSVEQSLQTDTEKPFQAEKLCQSDFEMDSQINAHIQNKWDLDDGSDIIDDSFNDPDFVPNDSNYDGTSEEEGTMDEEFSVRKLNRKRLAELDDNSLLHRRQMTGFERTTIYSDDSDFVPGSDNSCESMIIPDILQLHSQESRKVTDEAHCDSTYHSDEIATNQLDENSTSKFLPSLFSFSDTHKSNTVRFGLLPKQPKKTGCKQVYDKVNYCTYCKKAIRSKISRHLLTVHRSESRVYGILTLPKRSKERMVKLEILANEGNFKHNIEVLRNKVGFLAVGRRENQERNLSEDFKVGRYLPCDFCKKFILKETLWLHHKNCSVKHFMNKSNENEGKGNAVRLSRQLLNSAVLEEIDEGMSKLLSRMKEDEVTEVVKHDGLIKRYAALKVESLGRQQDQKINDMHKVSQSCRTLSRLVIKCREKSEHVVDLNWLISPNNFDLVVNATKSMCLENENEKSAPSLGKLVGNNLAHIIQVKKGASLRNDDSKGLQEAENFQRLFKAEWNYRINSVFQRMTNTINRQNVKTIPLTEDLQKLRNYILTAMQNESASLEKKACSVTWAKLAKLTLCRLLLFNKRRRAEVKDLKLAEYETRPNWKEEQQGEFKMALSSSDRMLAERMDMVISAGKSLKNVDAYVIMPPDAKSAVTLLNRTRHEVGVSTSNPYIFARLNSDSPLSGNSDLKQIVAECPGLQHQERITSTGLRRYIATVTQILDMSDSELESLARHLGHDVQTHRQNYRLSHATRELTVVSQLLIAVDNGMVNKWKGKRLSEISLDELPDVNEDDVEDDAEGYEGLELEERAQAVEELRALEAVDEAATADIQQHGPADTPLNDLTIPTDTMTLQDDPADIFPKKKIKRRWSKEEESYLRKTFKFYLQGTRSSVHNKDLLMAQDCCAALSTRTLAQIRTKLNNMKLGK